MRVTVNRKELLNALNTLKRVPLSSTIPILSNYYFEANDNELLLTAHNLVIGLTHTIDAVVDESGTACCNAKSLVELASLIDDDELEIIGSEGITINDKYFVAGLAPKDYCLLPSDKLDAKCTIDAAILAKTINKVIPAIDTRSAQSILRGINIKCSNNTMSVCCTDTRRLTLSTINNVVSTDFQVTIPIEAVGSVLSICDNASEIDIALNSTLMRLSTHRKALIINLLSGSYPNYEKLLKSDNLPVHKISVSRDALLHASKICSVFASIVTRKISITINTDSICLEASSSESGRCSVPVDATVDDELVGLKVWLNVSYLMGLINVFDDEVDIYMSSSDKMLVLRSVDNVVSLLMPMSGD